ncbi:unnamed protein product [Paramecium sonneborni]|uniref:Transmembrane protein n=1 Tax=Paramecium sonneborni TaxID=65129 RepID=A0A8S1PNU4_9CILI|nr:unnamed protein product [Paramecium sonneborni]
MNKLFQSLKKVDFFSVTYSPAISDGFNYNHSSILGGLISMLIAILSLMYSIYYIYLWWTYQLLPKVTSDINKFRESDDFGQLRNSIHVKSAYQEGWSPIDPFKTDEIIIQPLMIDLDDQELNWKPLLLTKQISEVLSINLDINHNKQYIILFTLCKEDYLLDQQKCASEETKNLYFQQNGNSLYIEISFTTINPSTFEPQVFERTYPINIHSQAEMCSSIILHYQMNQYLIDKAFLFSTGQEEFNYISNSLSYPQYSLKDYCDRQFLPNTFGAFFVLFQQQYYTVQIAYPPISEVFAAIGSIISILFSVKFLITLLNLHQLRQDILDEVMRQYYPEIKQFKIIKNLFGKITQVRFKGLPVEISSYVGFQRQIHHQMACKLNYKNLLYEISRFQFILMSIKRRTEIEKVHTIGIKVPIELSVSKDSYVITKGQINQLKTLNLRNIQQADSKYDILTINDALILSYDYKNFELTSTLFSHPSKTSHENNQNEQDFYEINRIEVYADNNEEF